MSIVDGPSAEIAYAPLNPAPTRKGSWMLTSTGVAYWALDPRVEDVKLEDIAHSLSLQCRYGGHSNQFYSVAEHSILVSRLVSPENALVALMHDATEAYVSDVPRPLKRHLANFEEIETLNWKVIAKAFDLPDEIPDEVHDVDTRICKTEMAYLLPTPPLALHVTGEAPDVRINCWSPEAAKASFLGRFNHLWNERMRKRYPALEAA